MKVIRPTTVLDSILISSTVPEPASGEVAWAAPTLYSVGQQVIRTTTHRRYERLVAGATPTAPESDATNWLDVGPTARWAMFDTQVSTYTETTGDLEVEIAAGGATAVAVLDAPGGSTVYDRTISLDEAVITDWYQYLTEPFSQRAEAIFTDLPTYASGRVIVTISGSTTRCGTLIVGMPFDLGQIQQDAKIGITDYSRKETDDFGVTTFVQRAFSKRLECTVTMPPDSLANAFRVLSQLRATPCVWIATEDRDLAPLLVYGYYREFAIVVTYRTHMLCLLEIEGLI